MSLTEGRSAVEMNSRQSKRLVVMGAAAVGKSSIISQLLDSKFNHSYRQTVEDYHHQEFNAEEYRLSLEILDTSGAFSFPAMRKLSIHTGDIFLLVYAINNEESIDELIRLMNQIIREKENEYPAIVIVGNKTDLEKERQVDRQGIEMLAFQLDSEHIETSAKDNTNLDLVLTKILQSANVPTQLVKAILHRRKCSDGNGHKQNGNRSAVKGSCILS
ncbi:GTP-binding protein Rhes-like [Glandiceps talaboti]